MTTVPALLHLFLLITVASCQQSCPDNVLPIDPVKKGDQNVAECGTREWNPDERKQGNQRWPWTVAIVTDRKDGDGNPRRIFLSNAVLVPDSSNNDVYLGGGKIIFYDYKKSIKLKADE